MCCRLRVLLIRADKALQQNCWHFLDNISYFTRNFLLYTEKVYVKKTDVEFTEEIYPLRGQQSPNSVYCYVMFVCYHCFVDEKVAKNNGSKFVVLICSELVPLI